MKHLKPSIKHHGYHSRALTTSINQIDLLSIAKNRDPKYLQFSLLEKREKTEISEKKSISRSNPPSILTFLSPLIFLPLFLLDFFQPPNVALYLDFSSHRLPSAFLLRRALLLPYPRRAVAGFFFTDAYLLPGAPCSFLPQPSSPSLQRWLGFLWPVASSPALAMAVSAAGS